MRFAGLFHRFKRGRDGEHRRVWRAGGDALRIRPEKRKGRLSGHVSLLAGPAYSKFIVIEPILRRLVPTLIIIFLIILGVARVFSLLAWRDDIELQHKAALSGATAHLAQMIERVANGIETGAQLSAKDLQDAMTELRSRGLTSSGMTIAIVDAQSMIKAASGPAGIAGSQIDTILGMHSRCSFCRARRCAQGCIAGRSRLRRAGQTNDRALFHHCGRTGKHHLCRVEKGCIAQCDAFAGTIGVMFAILYAYFSQAARAREADDLRADTAPHRHGAGARALRPLGLGHGARAHLLVTLHV